MKKVDMKELKKIIQNELDVLIDYIPNNTIIYQCAFGKRPDMDQSAKGVYVIYDKKTGMIIYVGEAFKGKGSIYKRFPPHWIKSLEDLIVKYPDKDTAGWRSLREDIEYNVADWEILYVKLDRSDVIGAVESNLILKLQPYANDEILENRINNKTKEVL